MRIRLGHFLPVLLIATPVFAQNWSYKPAPSEWYVPAPNAHRDISAPPIATQTDISKWKDDASSTNGEFTQAPTVITNQTEIRTAEQMGKTSKNLEAAITCAASLQIAALAAPEWSSEPGVAQATNLWLEKVFTEADKAGVAGDKVSDLVKTEMEKQTNEAATKPDALNKRAFNCAVNMPA